VFRPTLGLVVAVFALSACSGSLNRGVALYDEGRYVEAAEVFEKHEISRDSGGSARGTTYALYRGMTLLALGDERGAEHWLSAARERDHGTAALLPTEREQLQRSWQELGAHRRETWPAPGAPSRLAKQGGADQLQESALPAVLPAAAAPGSR